MTTQTLRIGSLAYFDSFAGLIPCKVIAITGPPGVQTPTSWVRVIAAVTVDKSPYRRGEIVDGGAFWIVPRNAVKRAIKGARVRAYLVEVPQ
jgi:hypothetical protein